MSERPLPGINGRSEDSRRGRGRYPEADIVGQTIGWWYVERILPKQRGIPRQCACLCTGCGTRKLVKKNHLISGETMSCGCKTVRDLTGMRVGRLRVVRQAKKEFPHAGAAWECRCDCGNRCVVRSSHLARLRTPVRSCGKCGMRQRNAVRERSEPTVRCIACRPGIYNHRRIAVGEVLDVKESSFCSSWLRRMPPTTPTTDDIEDEEPESPYVGPQAALERRLARPFEVSEWSRRRHDGEADDLHSGRALADLSDDVDD